MWHINAELQKVYQHYQQHSCLLMQSLHRTPATFGTSKLGERDWYEDPDDIHAQRKVMHTLGH